MITTKGGTLGSAFQIRLTDDLATKGEALLTSSAADEASLESSEIGGSYFTHHFVSGLRGAADVSGDGRVTLSEAYQYAYAHTITTTGQTVIGPQHPEYDYRLSGQGELILTELAKPTAALQLPTGFERGLVVDLARDQVIAELTSDARPTIAVEPGRYAIRAWRNGKMLVGRVVVAARESRAIRWSELVETAVAPTRNKGSDVALAGSVVADADVTHPWPALVVSAGVQRGLTQPIGVVPIITHRAADGVRMVDRCHRRHSRSYGSRRQPPRDSWFARRWISAGVAARTVCDVGRCRARGRARRHDR